MMRKMNFCASGGLVAMVTAWFVEQGKRGANSLFSNSLIFLDLPNFLIANSWKYQRYKVMNIFLVNSILKLKIQKSPKDGIIVCWSLFYHQEDI
ncbi:hypothetical protein AVEN_132512-1 [Araneus ventricosus]|uniref:Uncharacterized protein n=1 Tax=Araneus ventricosus TaxID=182803 RepID=A0A4Y2BIZ2_ARAVE|nr:hypothetical protein AVEN_132512-1 [Araneus ventricosus]